MGELIDKNPALYDHNDYVHRKECKCWQCVPDHPNTAEVLRSAIIDLDGCWGHDNDGSELIVKSGKLFDITFNVAIKAMKRAEKELKEKK